MAWALAILAVVAVVAVGYALHRWSIARYAGARADATCADARRRQEAAEAVARAEADRQRARPAADVIADAIRRPGG